MAVLAVARLELTIARRNLWVATSVLLMALFSAILTVAGGAPCDGDKEEEKPCNAFPCPAWTTWGRWRAPEFAKIPTITLALATSVERRLA